MEYKVGDYVEVVPQEETENAFRGVIKGFDTSGCASYPILVIVDEDCRDTIENGFLENHMEADGECWICEKEIAGLVNSSKHKRIPTVFLEGIEL